ncbi:diguanylate cyclase [Thermodesulfobium narugense DSM 14796]|uniref:diguanylate cyclase n=1 Tax=Thermodesulfobium narugense DSM 14796 TaxID=747365 RepID=M1E777_9BACT|nr:GGDEF domain-containing protein [Thermodesulfobium narugense]AEE14528.1 diguanylate cyclase [Thermodesulfobium narugense DSM 14796]
MCKTENSLDLSLNTLKFILENVEVGFCVYDVGLNKIVYANKYFMKLVNLELDDILSLDNPFILFPENKVAYVKEYMNIKINDLDESNYTKKYVKLRRLKNSTIVHTKFRILKFEQNNKPFLLISASNVTSLVKKIKNLDNKAQTDFLTGIYNRFSMEEKLTRLSQSSNSFGLIMFDIDNFKFFNDTYGHSKGDEILKKIAEKIKSSLRETDIFVRWGGDEFLLILMGVSKEDLLKIAKKIRNKVSEIDFGISEVITLSMGIGTFDNNNIDLDLLVEKVDNAMLKAKSLGKDTFIWCE